MARASSSRRISFSLLRLIPALALLLVPFLSYTRAAPCLDFDFDPPSFTSNTNVYAPPTGLSGLDDALDSGFASFDPGFESVDAREALRLQIRPSWAWRWRAVANSNFRGRTGDEGGVGAVHSVDREDEKGTREFRVDADDADADRQGERERPHAYGHRGMRRGRAHP